MNIIKDIFRLQGQQLGSITMKQEVKNYVEHPVPPSEEEETYSCMAVRPVLQRYRLDGLENNYSRIELIEGLIEIAYIVVI